MGLLPLAPEASVSTNFTTPAYEYIKNLKDMFDNLAREH